MSPATSVTKAAAVPDLTWITGSIHQIFAQPAEKYYTYSVRAADKSLILRLADAHNGAPIDVTTGTVAYDLLKEAYFRKLTAEIGYRDFGYDPQSGSNKLCIDRVSLNQ